MDRLKNKIAIVTGGASGIGAAIVRRFREEGATVVVFDLLDCEGAVKVDVSSEKDVKNAVARVFDTYGRIDILVNNAGWAGENSPTHLMSEEGWDKTFDVDVKGVLFCTKHVLPVMIAGGGGSIVNMSSIYATYGTFGDLTAYHAAKGAVLSMTRQDAVTYGRKKVRVNAILPGAIDTPLLRELGGQFKGGWGDYEAYVSKRTPLDRLGLPEDIANGALYLASDESSFVTGTALYIDGGYTAR